MRIAFSSILVFETVDTAKSRCILNLVQRQHRSIRISHRVTVKESILEFNPPEYDLLAEIYDIWADADPASLPSHDFYVDLCAETRGLVVELGVGTGRIAVDIAKRNKAISGVDISKPMLRICVEKARQANVTDRLDLINGDIRTLKLPQLASLITFPFRSIGHMLSIDDKREALENIYRNLQDDGRFVFDHYVFDEDWALRHDGIPRLMHGTISHEHGGLFIWDTYQYDLPSQQMHCFITVERTDGVGRIHERTHCPLSFSWLLPEQVRMLASQAGFVIDDVYGDFSGGPFGPDSKNQVWLLRRPG